jgi:hypothetical protein
MRIPLKREGTSQRFKHFKISLTVWVFGAAENTMAHSDCRKLPSAGGSMCRVTVRPEMKRYHSCSCKHLTRITDPFRKENKFNHKNYKVFDLVCKLEACASDTLNVDVASLKQNFIPISKANGFTFRNKILLIMPR